MMIFRKCALGAVVAFGLSGCEIPVMMAAEANDAEMTGMFEITFPAMVLVLGEEGFEEILTGEMQGYANGNATFALTGPYSGDCTGAASRAGEIEMTCDSGLEIRRNVGPQRARMTGTYVLTGEFEGRDFISAMGWGNDANEPAVRAAIAAAQAG